MLFYATHTERYPASQNPTFVVLTDWNDLDDQLHGQFRKCHKLLGQVQHQAASVADLRTKLDIPEHTDPPRTGAY